MNEYMFFLRCIGLERPPTLVIDSNTVFRVQSKIIVFPVLRPGVGNDFFPEPWLRLCFNIMSRHRERPKFPEGVFSSSGGGYFGFSARGVYTPLKKPEVRLLALFRP